MWGVCERCILGDRRRCMWLTAYFPELWFLTLLLLALFLALNMSKIKSFNQQGHCSCFIKSNGLGGLTCNRG